MQFLLSENESRHYQELQANYAKLLTRISEINMRGNLDPSEKAKAVEKNILLQIETQMELSDEDLAKNIMGLVNLYIKENFVPANPTRDTDGKVNE